MDRYIPAIDGPVDLEQLIELVPEPLLKALYGAARAAWAVGSTVTTQLDRLKKKKG